MEKSGQSVVERNLPYRVLHEQPLILICGHEGLVQETNSFILQYQHITNMCLSIVILLLMLFTISNNERKYQSPHVRESGFQNPGIFVGGMWNPGLWNPEYSSTDKNWNPLPGIRNPQRGIENPRLYGISLHGVILNALKCVLPTSFRVALVCNHPALCSLYASRVGFETVRTLIYVVAFAYYCCTLTKKI